MLTTKSLKFFLKDKTVASILIGSILINLAVWLNLLRIKKTTELIPLHYNIYFGIDYIGEWHKLFTIAGVGLLVLLINFLLSLLFYFKDKFIAYTLLITALFVQIILILSSLAIVWINI
ncbi:hypothetical protein HOD96_02295 [Candidatus Falkowbacteria bacterium]|jgi:hypothetical protein|nr:hypothetical protein [Candidatus Falkowbacteria bacterium]MBT4433121.1 hypothetical protein [Candidatus Falkowbacteria bacterium]